MKGAAPAPGPELPYPVPEVADPSGKAPALGPELLYRVPEVADPWGEPPAPGPEHVYPPQRWQIQPRKGAI